MNNVYVESVVFFVIGIITGSFLHLCAYRLPRRKSILFPSSHCPHCTTRIKAVDLVPLLSYIWLQGKCRFCGARISISHPLIELLTGLLFMIAYLRFGLSTMLIKALLLISLLMIIAMIDLKHYVIPNKLTALVLLLGLAFVLFTGEPTILSALTGFGAAFLFLLFLALVSRGGMGGGDIKLAAVIGLCLGWPDGITAVLLGCLCWQDWWACYCCCCV
ncbi:MAG: prepilin peptidase [Candidatus Syntrophopropionicum ammoniitolerans]